VTPGHAHAEQSGGRGPSAKPEGEALEVQRRAEEVVLGLAAVAKEACEAEKEVWLFVDLIGREGERVEDELGASQAREKEAAGARDRHMQEAHELRTEVQSLRLQCADLEEQFEDAVQIAEAGRALYMLHNTDIHRYICCTIQTFTDIYVAQYRHSQTYMLHNTDIHRYICIHIVRITYRTNYICCTIQTFTDIYVYISYELHIVRILIQKYVYICMYAYVNVGVRTHTRSRAHTHLYVVMYVYSHVRV